MEGGKKGERWREGIDGKREGVKSEGGEEL